MQHMPMPAVVMGGEWRWQLSTVVQSRTRFGLKAARPAQDQGKLYVTSGLRLALCKCLSSQRVVQGSTCLGHSARVPRRQVGRVRQAAYICIPKRQRHLQHDGMSEKQPKRPELQVLAAMVAWKCAKRCAGQQEREEILLYLQLKEPLSASMNLRARFYTVWQGGSASGAQRTAV